MRTTTLQQNDRARRAAEPVHDHAARQDAATRGPGHKYRQQADWLAATTALLLSILTGCMTVGPDYAPPSPDDAIAADWISDDTNLTSTNTVELATWWQLFQDPVLDALVQKASSENLELEQARSRVREARARSAIAMAARFPNLGADGSAARAKQGEQPTTEMYAVGFDAAWEIDLFGRVTRQIEAATADAQSQLEAQRAAQTTLSAELALTYTEYRTLEKRIQHARENTEKLQATYDQVVIRHESELADRLQVAQAAGNLAAGRARIPPLEAGRHRAANRLAVLTGQRPGALNDVLKTSAPIPVPPAHIEIGIPADLLRRRPDIRQAERELAAQSARVGVAMADLYPRFRFHGVLNFNATGTASLFEESAQSARLGPSFSWNLFNAGSVRNNIRVQNERQQQALLRYEQTVLRALEETENALFAYQQQRQHYRRREEAATAARTAAELAYALYNDGIKDFILVLDAQRTLLDADDQLALSSAEVTTQLIRLYKALGGGW